MTDGVTNCLNQSNAGLLQVCIYAQNTALVIEGVEQSCQLIGIGCHMMYSTLTGCTGKQFRIFAQLFNKRQLFGSLQSIQLQLVQSYSLNACFGQLTGNAADTRMRILDIINRVSLDFSVARVISKSSWLSKERMQKK